MIEYWEWIIFVPRTECVSMQSRANLKLANSILNIIIPFPHNTSLVMFVSRQTLTSFMMGVSQTSNSMFCMLMKRWFAMGKSINLVHFLSKQICLVIWYSNLIWILFRTQRALSCYITCTTTLSNVVACIPNSFHFDQIQAKGNALHTLTLTSSTIF